MHREQSSFGLHCVFDDFRVDTGHPVHCMRSNDAQVSHVDLLDSAFLDQGHSAHAVNIARVQLGDALHGSQHRLRLHDIGANGTYNIVLASFSQSYAKDIIYEY